MKSFLEKRLGTKARDQIDSMTLHKLLMQSCDWLRLLKREIQQ